MLLFITRDQNLQHSGELKAYTLLLNKMITASSVSISNNNYCTLKQCLYLSLIEIIHNINYHSNRQRKFLLLDLHWISLFLLLVSMSRVSSPDLQILAKKNSIYPKLWNIPILATHTHFGILFLF